MTTISGLQVRLRKFFDQLPYLPRALRLVWEAAKVWTTLWAVSLVLRGLLPVATVYLTKGLVDSIVAVIQNGAEYRAAILYAGAMAGVLLASEVLGSVGNWISTAQSELVRDHIQNHIHGKSTQLDLAFYDSAGFYDQLHRARSEAAYRPIALLEGLGSLLQNTITLVAMGAVLLRFGVWLPFALVVSTIPALAVVMRHTVREHEWRRRVTPDERRAWYYDWLLTSREAAAEVRLFGLEKHFRSAYREVRHRLRTERVRLSRQQSAARLSAGVLGLLVMGATTIWMVLEAVEGRATLGDLALFYQAVNQGLRLMRTLLENAGQLYANVLFLGNLFEFLELEPGISDPEKPLPAPAELLDGIRFRDVSFRYPGTEDYAVRHLDAEIPAGRITAIVGNNGAGKSTLIRLLCRFYDVETGQIELDGVSTSDMTVEALRARISVLFQEPVHYNATVTGNISAGERVSEPRTVAAAAEAAGADEFVRRLPRGYDTILGRWFADGAELSVGEWQRVALARAYVGNAPILVLDEPTSAMDPWSELGWMERFRKVAAGRTAIIITHRLTTARLADFVHVMADGKVAESGTHQELLDRKGSYAQAWATQGR